jgi:hypothetical protein
MTYRIQTRTCAKFHVHNFSGSVVTQMGLKVKYTFCMDSVFIFHSFIFLNDDICGTDRVPSTLQQEKLQQKLPILKKFVTTQNVSAVW